MSQLIVVSKISCHGRVGSLLISEVALPTPYPFYNQTEVITGCKTANAALFFRHYNGNRSPVGVNLRAVWLEKDHHFQAMLEFVEMLALLHDVYMVSTWSYVQISDTQFPI